MITLTPDDIEAIADRVVTKMATIRIRTASASDEVVDRAEAMRVLNCNSDSALDRALADMGIKRVRPGHFRRGDITNAIATRTANRAP